MDPSYLIWLETVSIHKAVSMNCSIFWKQIYQSKGKRTENKGNKKLDKTFSHMFTPHNIPSMWWKNKANEQSKSYITSTYITIIVCNTSLMTYYMYSWCGDLFSPMFLRGTITIRGEYQASTDGLIRNDWLSDSVCELICELFILWINYLNGSCINSTSNVFIFFTKFSFKINLFFLVTGPL